MLHRKPLRRGASEMFIGVEQPKQRRNEQKTNENTGDHARSIKGDDGCMSINWNAGINIHAPQMNAARHADNIRHSRVAQHGGGAQTVHAVVAQGDNA